MSIHASLSPEAQAELRSQRLRASLSSVVFAILIMALIGLALQVVLLKVWREKVPTIVAYQNLAEDKPTPESPKVQQFRSNPSSPSSSAVRVLAVSVPTPTTIAVPEANVDSVSMEFGSGNDFGQGWDGDGAGASGGGPFGTTHGSGLEGTFYDLKQDPKGKPTEMTFQDFEKDGTFDSGAPVNPMYDEHLERAVRRNLEGSALARFFQAPKKLRLSQLYVPRLLAEEAPREFHIDDQVQGRRWIIAYRGTVTPPVSGRFRFVGFSDDVLVVLANDRVVLDGSLESPLKSSDRRKFIHQTHTVTGWQTYLGNWMNVDAGRPIDLKIMIGERPGGHYSGYLLLEKSGVDYRKDSNGSPILPLFKMAPSEMPERGETLPELAPDAPWSIWPGKP